MNIKQERYENAKRYERAVKGMRSKVAGEHFENMITAACAQYREERMAEIAKTPEPMRPISGQRNGKFIAIFTKRAQPDFKGVMNGGRCVVFEAKHTDSGKMMKKAVTEEQARQLDRYWQMGAWCFVLVSFDFYRFFRVPWSVWRDMKDYFGRAYFTPAEAHERKYEIYADDKGTLRFLRGELNGESGY